MDLVTVARVKVAQHEKVQQHHAGGTSTITSQDPQVVILDSSFNPPTLAHLSMIHQGLASVTLPVSLILLLSIKNADKPASERQSFARRVQMMWMLAQMLATAPEETSLPRSLVSIDVALTKTPYFHDKAATIEKALPGPIPPSSTEPIYRPGLHTVPAQMMAQQVWLLGHDTMLRFLNPSYYKPAESLDVLIPFFEKHRICVVPRLQASPDASSGTLDTGDPSLYLAQLVAGQRQIEGWRNEWKDNFLVLAGRSGEPISSTQARHAAHNGDVQRLKSLVIQPLVSWILQEKLYASRDSFS